VGCRGRRGDEVQGEREEKCLFVSKRMSQGGEEMAAKRKAARLSIV
jgi:hypothetical protein